MITRTNFSFSLCAFGCLGVGMILAPITPLLAQGPSVSTTEVQTAPVPADVFSFEIGHAAKAGAVYTISATQPATSKLIGQKIRLQIVEKTGPADTTTSYRTHWPPAITRPWRSWTPWLVDIFRRFLAAPVAGQEIGKIGDMKHGGEVRFVVDFRRHSALR